jgi:hypothetical protein
VPVPEPTPPPAGPGRKRPFWLNPWLWGVVAFIALDALFRFTPLLRRIPDPPPVVETLPDFELIRAGGQPFTRADLADTVHLAGFAPVDGEAGKLIGAMLELEAYLVEQAPYERYSEELRLMLISAGPRAPSPQALMTLRRDEGLDPDRWTLLTGDTDPLFRVLAAAQEAPDSGEQAGLIALIDGDGGIRGFYDPSTEEGREEAFWRGMRTLEEQHIGDR